MTDAIGLYIHVPFCVKKCGYCDFYSVAMNDLLISEYTDTVAARLNDLPPNLRFDTVYFGGGTPSLLGGKNIAKILDAAGRDRIASNAEITVEANPGDDLGDFFAAVSSAGVNRVSLGLQSADDDELKKLTRRHTSADASAAVKSAKRCGIDNISLDVMIGIEGQTEDSLRKTIAFCDRMGVSHVSAYMLKIEPDTPFAKRGDTAEMQDDDRLAELYLTACDELERLGYRQYEISNFARSDAFSRHNMKYWNCEEYIGIGPSAHSFYGGRRFYYPRSLSEFLAGTNPVDDGAGGDFDEYAMLRLRLRDGLRFDSALARFGQEIAPRLELINERSRPMKNAGLVCERNDAVSLTVQGFLLSNSIIAGLLK
jgi:oxygen-independent coproporphyrinogen-3 oxidase